MAKDQFGFGTENKIDWISFKHEGKKYEFMNIPEVHEIMQSGSLFKMQDTFDALINKGFIRSVKKKEN